MNKYQRFSLKKISPHQLGICDVLSALKLTDEYPKQLCLIGVQPQSLAPNIGLTEVVKQSFPQIYSTLAEQLQVLGLPTQGLT